MKIIVQNFAVAANAGVLTNRNLLARVDRSTRNSYIISYFNLCPRSAGNDNRPAVKANQIAQKAALDCDVLANLQFGTTFVLYDLYQQLQANGIQLYNTQGADDLVFPSGADQSQRVFLPSSVTVQNGGTADLSVSLAHAAKEPVTLNWKIAEGSAAGTIGGQTSGTLTFDVGNQSQTLTVQAENSDERWNGNRAFVVEFSVADGALFDNESACGYTTVLVHSDYTYPELNRDAIGQAGGQEFDLIYYPYESSQETPVEIENFMFKNGTGFGEFENFENPPWLILTVNNSKGHQVQYTKIRSNADYIYDNGYTLRLYGGMSNVASNQSLTCSASLNESRPNHCSSSLLLK